LENDPDLACGSRWHCVRRSRTYWTASRLKDLPDWVPSKQLTLGLDLQGGSYMLLQVERQDIIKDRLTTTVDDVRRLLREAGIGYTGLSGTGQMVQVRIRDDARIEEAKETLSELSAPVASGLFGGGSVIEAIYRGNSAGPAPHPAF
jgi:SecD/SecF fusion protein